MYEVSEGKPETYRASMQSTVGFSNYIVSSRHTCFSTLCGLDCVIVSPCLNTFLLHEVVNKLLSPALPIKHGSPDENKSIFETLLRDL